MYCTCRSYLIGKLAEAGVKARPITSYKRLRITQDTRIAAVLSDRETLRRTASNRSYRDQSGARHMRRKVYDRETAYNVIIGDPDPEVVERLFDSFLACLDSGIIIDGNYTPIEVVSAEWADDEDSILKSKLAVNVALKFIGGVYRDSDYAHIKEIEIVDISREES